MKALKIITYIVFAILCLTAIANGQTDAEIFTAIEVHQDTTEANLVKQFPGFSKSVNMIVSHPNTTMQDIDMFITGIVDEIGAAFNDEEAIAILTLLIIRTNRKGNELKSAYNWHFAVAHSRAYPTLGSVGGYVTSL